MTKDESLLGTAVPGDPVNKSTPHPLAAIYADPEFQRAYFWGLVNEIERAAWRRSFTSVRAARSSLESIIGPRPKSDLESASQFRRMEAQRVKIE